MDSTKQTKKKPPYGVLQNSIFTAKLLWSWDKPIIFLLLANIPIISLLPLCTVYIPKVIVQAIETRQEASPLILSVLLLGAVFLLLTILQKFIETSMNFHITYVSNRLSFLVNSKAMDMDYQNLDKPSTQTLIRKAFEIIEGQDQKGIQALLSLFIVIFSNLLGFTIYTGILSTLSPLIIVLILFATLISHFVNLRVNRWIYEHKDNWLKLDHKLSYLGYKSSSFDVAKDIRLYNMRSWCFGTFSKFMKERIHWTVSMQFYYFLCGITGSVLVLLRDGGAYAYLIYLVWKGSLSISDFVLYFGLISGFSNWCMQIIRNISSITYANYDICDLRTYLELPDHTNRKTGVSASHKQEFPCEIQLNHVCYRYTGEEKDTISDINLTIQPGEKIAVVGANGAGKTTLVKLICGLYQATSGEIKINGHKAEEYNRDEYYKLFSPVFQDVRFLPVSVKRNIALCEENEIDEQRLHQCLLLSEFDKIVKKLPHGLDTLLISDMDKEAVQLSGGEQQKLMLARALYKDAAIMILDEPTAALDPIAENAMYLKYNELTKNCTSLFISHRLASTRFCNRIIFMEHGKIIEIGTHEDLLKAGGKYKEMFDVQAKYYKENPEGRDENA